MERAALYQLLSIKMRKKLTIYHLYIRTVLYHDLFLYLFENLVSFSFYQRTNSFVPCPFDYAFSIVNASPDMYSSQKYNKMHFP
jgi:hypothetical protein